MRSTKTWKHLPLPKFYPVIFTVIIIALSGIFMNLLTTSQSLTISQESLTIHEEPSTRSKIVTNIEKNHRIHILDQKKQWYYVRVNNHIQGWVPQWLVDTPALKDEKDLFIHIQKETPLYQTNKKDSKTDHIIEADTYLPIQEVSYDWIKIAHKDQTGFIPINNAKILMKNQLPKELQDINNERIGDIELNKTTDNTVYVRANQAYFMDGPSYYANTIYDTNYNQEFEFIENTFDDQGEEFYLVKDKDGNQGYLNARIVAFAKDYQGHNDQTDATSLKEATILIDPGHGGEDNGAYSLDGVYSEKEFTLPTALKIKEALEAKGATVHLTRETDSWVELTDRVDQSNQLEVDAFLSIHFDASSDPTWHGSSIYYFHEGDYNLANYVNQELTNLPVQNNGTLFGNFQVMRDNDYPAILLELGFITNDYDRSYILQEDYQQECANMIAQGLENYFSEKL